MSQCKRMLPYLLVMALDFYLLPFLISDTGTAMLILLIAVPLICVACSAVYGAKNGFHLLFCLLVAILFVPTIFVFYNSSAWIYVIGYGIAAIVGNALGAGFHQRTK